MASISSRMRRGLRDLSSVLAAAAVALVARSSFADHYVVPSGSMLPTVQLQDHVVVSKLAYGVHVPLLPGYVARFEGPARGDVVVLTAPDTGIVLLKRVVAVPGDRVRVHGGQLEVNGTPVPSRCATACPARGARTCPATTRSISRTGGGPDLRADDPLPGTATSCSATTGATAATAATSASFGGTPSRPGGGRARPRRQVHLDRALTPPRRRAASSRPPA